MSSSLPDAPAVPPASNQFIRPTSTFDTASAAEWLELKGADFAASDKVATAMKWGVAAELADAVMVALGSRFESLSDEDVCTRNSHF